VAALALCALLALRAATALAHHSFAMYDSDHQVKLTGAVVSLIWSNPHVYLQIAVEEERGTRNTYTLECASPVILQRQGWQFNMIRPGDRVTAIIAPLRNGDPGGLVKVLILPDGRRLSNGTLAGQPSID
jgi:hypothetical protein